jgi:hypothetical protein
MPEANRQVTLHSRLENTLVTKIFGPLFFLVMAFVLVAGDFPGRRLLLATPLLATALFGATLAILEVRGGVLRYKRLFRWTTIREHEIKEARPEWPPFIGSIRFNRLLFPWGRLYFVLDANLNANPFGKGDFALLRYLRGEPIRGLASHELDSTGGANSLRMLGAAAVGAFSELILRLILPSSGSVVEPTQPASGHRSAVFEIVWQVTQFLWSPRMLLVFCVVFVVLSVRKRRSPEAWTFAFVSGFLATQVLLKLLGWV